MNQFKYKVIIHMTSYLLRSVQIWKYFYFANSGTVIITRERRLAGRWTVVGENLQWSRTVSSLREWVTAGGWLKEKLWLNPVRGKLLNSLKILCDPVSQFKYNSPVQELMFPCSGQKSHQLKVLMIQNLNHSEDLDSCPRWTWRENSRESCGVASAM